MGSGSLPKMSYRSGPLPSGLGKFNPIDLALWAITFLVTSSWRDPIEGWKLLEVEVHLLELQQVVWFHTKVMCS
ncbi:hypothetical protein WN943_022926 [Citrus x changshan-huyou]